MKIRTIIAVGLSLVALASCSKDSQPVNVKDMKDAKVNLALRASAPASKAGDDANALDGELNINSMTVLSFTSDGAEALVDPYWTNEVSTVDGVSTVLNIPTKATRAMIAILANVPQGAFSGVNSYSDFQDRLAQLSDQSQSNLGMSAQVITADETLINGDNYIGYGSQANINGINSPLELTRLAARVELALVKTTFANTKLAGRTVRINSVRLANQKTASRYASTDYWGAVMASGNQGASGAISINMDTNDNTQITSVPYRQYTMENTDETNPTQIVVNATILAGNGYQAQTKEFAATINDEGKGDHYYVKRNFIYRLKINFGGNSFDAIADEDPVPPTPPTPSTGDLNVSVEVVGWGPVDQESVVK